MKNRTPSARNLRRAILPGAAALCVGSVLTPALAKPAPSASHRAPSPDAQAAGVQASQGDGRVFPLYTPFAPPQNQPDADRQMLGKILFWDEQLSSDNTVSCGTCHIPSAGGADPREGVNPAYDGIFDSEDDVAGSPGVILTDENGEYLRSVLFELLPQTTPRRSMSNLFAMFAGNLFWDGRAEGDYVDPVTGEILAQSSAGLEIQSLAPVMSDVEMAHRGEDWTEVLTRLAQARPLALASEIPQEMADAIAAHPTYPELFEQAFGDPEITAGRIGFAIANYERSLVPDQTPWDLWNAGDDSAMSAQDVQGYDIFRASACVNCHVPPMFTTHAFTINGVRPIIEDEGRGGVTGSPPERGAFRMTTLRNLGNRDRFMHTGGLGRMEDVFDFYAHRNGRVPFPQNLDNRLRNPIEFTPGDQAKIKHFILNALTDPRVINEEYPFDRPKLYTESQDPNPGVLDGGTPGAGGYTPQIIAVTPPVIGNTGFKIGLDFALGGAQAWVAVSQSAPTGGVVAPDELLGPIELHGMSAGEGYATMFYSIDDPAMDGQTFYMQWVIADPAAADGLARSQPVRVTPFCTMTAPCSPVCVADLTGDGALDFFDVSAFLNAFNAQDPDADLDGNGSFNYFDVSGFLNAFAAGCP